jgi:hypothetical protein
LAPRYQTATAPFLGRGLDWSHCLAVQVLTAARSGEWCRVRVADGAVARPASWPCSVTPPATPTQSESVRVSPSRPLAGPADRQWTVRRERRKPQPTQSVRIQVIAQQAHPKPASKQGELGGGGYDHGDSHPVGRSEPEASGRSAATPAELNLVCCCIGRTIFLFETCRSCA